MKTVFWDVTPYEVVESYQQFGVNHCLYLQSRRLFCPSGFNPENGGSRFLPTARLYDLTSQKTVMVTNSIKLQKNYERKAVVSEIPIL
jgi:hypothetical protein